MRPAVSTSLAALVCALELLSGCSFCSSDTPKPVASAAASAAAAPSAAPAGPPDTLPRRNLAARDTLEVENVVEKRAMVLEQLEAASEAKGGAPAIDALAKAVEADPTGGAVALAMSRAELEGGNAAEAARWARRAEHAALGRSDLLADARVALGAALARAGEPSRARAAYEQALAASPKHEAARAGLAAVAAPAAPAGDGGKVDAASAIGWALAPDVQGACAVLEREVTEGKVPLLSTAKVDAGSVTCALDAALVFATPVMDRAYGFRVEVKGPAGTDRLLWVGLDAATGFHLYGPIASTLVTGPVGAESDVVLDLQKVDVLPGGSPELVAKIVEVRTVVDVALNELLLYDVTRATLLTADEKPRASRTVTLEMSTVRRALLPKEKKMPRGYKAGKDLGESRGYHMKVEWSGPNSMTLTRASGKGKPDVEGRITLFE